MTLGRWRTIREQYDDQHVYCGVSDVAKYFRKEGAFGTDDNPSQSQVKEMIEDRSAYIDRQTRRAWRENKVVNETKRFDTRYRWDAGRPVMLNKLDVISPLDSAEGDKLEIWEGSDWHDWVADTSLSEGRDGNYWLDPSMGQLFVYKRFTWHSKPQIRVSYRYGREVTDSDSDNVPDDLPRDIREACAKLVAIDLVASDQHSQLLPGGDGGPSPESAMENWRTDVFGDQRQTGILERHKHDPVWAEPY